MRTSKMTLKTKWWDGKVVKTNVLLKKKRYYVIEKCNTTKIVRFVNINSWVRKDYLYLR